GIGAVALPLDLVRGRRDVLDPQRGGEGRGGLPLVLGERVGVGGGGQDPLGAQRTDGRRQQERRVGAAGEGHHEAGPARQIGQQRRDSSGAFLLGSVHSPT